MEGIQVLADLDRVTGIRPSLETHDDVRVRREEVDDLALPLVAELTADDHRGGHDRGRNVRADLRILSRAAPRTDVTFRQKIL
jgi:hypothetical protein